MRHHKPYRFFIFMTIESFLPFLLILAPFLIAFTIEAAVMALYKLKSFWTCLGVSVLLNLISFTLLYFIASPILSLFGYNTANFNGFVLAPQAVAFLCWFSIVAEALLLQFFIRKAQKKSIFSASILMNALSFLFLYLFIVNSH